MIITKVKKGAVIDTQYGFLCVEGCNDGGLFSVVEYEFDDDEFGKNDGTQIITEKALMLTVADIERRMKEFDGKNHRVIWDE